MDTVTVPRRARVRAQWERLLDWLRAHPGEEVSAVEIYRLVQSVAPHTIVSQARARLAPGEVLESRRVRINEKSVTLYRLRRDGARNLEGPAS